MDSGGVVNHLCGMCVCVTGLAASSTKAKVCVSIIRMATQLHERTCIFSQSVLTLNVLRVRPWWGVVGRIRGGSDQCVWLCVGRGRGSASESASACQLLAKAAVAN